MLSINQQKLIRSLHQKKYRDQHGLFILEGVKIITDLLDSEELNKNNAVLICCTNDWLEENSNLPQEIRELCSVSDYSEIRKLSSLVSPQALIAVVKKPEPRFKIESLSHNITLVFDALRDPGNLGTIIRTADWFGIKNIICSTDSVDQYNNKVVQSSMGAILRTQLHYMDLSELFEEIQKFGIPVYGTAMNGKNIYDTQIIQPGLIVFGNESKGIKQELKSYFKADISIPDYPEGKSLSESLNIAAAVAIFCSELRRRGK